MRIERIGIVGAGVIGSSWAAFYAAKGLRVKMTDLDPEICAEAYNKSLEYIAALSKGGLIDDTDAQQAVSNISIENQLEHTIEGVQLVQESVAENYEVKHQVFKAIDAKTSPDVILASSSSGLLMTAIQKATRHPQRCLIAHPFNPPHLIPLVELVPGQSTDRMIISKMKAFFESLGKVPVVLKKEAPGHIANRLAAALWREAVDIVLKDIASVEDVDKTICAGPGLRWALMGQHLIYHLGGGEGGMASFIDHLGPAFEVWWKNLADWTSLPAEAKDVLIKGLAEETGGRNLQELNQWRDAKLIKLLKTIYE
jgi:carnitine 3-dehydrogenase